MSQQSKAPKQCAIVVRQGRDDQRVDKLLSLIPQDIHVVLFSGESGKAILHLRPESTKNESVAVDFVLLHREDESCWKGVKERLTGDSAIVFCFHGEGTPRTLDYPGSLPIRRKTTGGFDITESDMIQIINHVFEKGPIPSCCRTASTCLLAIRGLCEGFIISETSLQDLISKGVSNPLRVKKAAAWFSDQSNWKDVLGEEFLNRLAEEGVHPAKDSKLFMLNQMLNGDKADGIDNEKTAPQSSKTSSDIGRELVRAIAHEVCEELKKHA